LRELVLVGSGDLAHIVAGDDDDVEGESWEVWTLADGQQDWVRPSIGASRSS
jgi:hypothetical protein